MINETERSPSASGLWTCWRIFKDRTEGIRNNPPQCVPLWPVDYFEPKAIKTLQTRHRDSAHQTDVHGVQNGEDGANEESNMETYTLPYLKQITSGNLLYDSGNSNRGSVTIQRGGVGWDGGSGGRRHMYTYG